jgi:hypothetical protein
MTFTETSTCGTEQADAYQMEREDRQNEEQGDTLSKYTDERHGAFDVF